MLRINTLLASPKTIILNAFAISRMSSRHFFSKQNQEKSSITTDKNRRDIETLRDKAPYISKEGLPEGVFSDSEFEKLGFKSDNIKKLEAYERAKEYKQAIKQNNCTEKASDIKNDSLGKCDSTISYINTGKDRNQSKTKNNDIEELLFDVFGDVIFDKAIEIAAKAINCSLKNPESYISKIAEHFGIKKISITSKEDSNDMFGGTILKCLAISVPSKSEKITLTNIQIVHQVNILIKKEILH